MEGLSEMPLLSPWDWPMRAWHRAPQLSMWHNPVRNTVRVPHKGARTPIRSADNLMALTICPICHTPIGVASGHYDMLKKVSSLVSIGGDMPCDVLEGRG